MTTMPEPVRRLVETAEESATELARLVITKTVATWQVETHQSAKTLRAALAAVREFYGEKEADRR
jgi:hypothetical protein